MLRPPDPVVMLIADISGYTSYLSGTEIDHAQNVLQDLLETIVARLEPPLKLIEVEGDACFTFAPTADVSGTLLLDTIDAAYFGFRHRLRDVTQATTCTCNACLLIPNLDLKFIVHAGEAVRQRAFSRENLVGPDVIAIHRLLKNHVTEQTGWRAYALLTTTAASVLAVDCRRMDMVALREEYDVGTVDVFVEDLDARWEIEQEAAHSHLAGDRVWMTFEIDLAAPPAVIWQWLTSPRLRPYYQVGVLRVTQDAAGGRAGIGSMNHCAHGPNAVTLEHVVDWKPFETYTLNSQIPLIGPLTFSYDLAAADWGTHVTVLMGGDADNPIRSKFHLAEPFLQGMYMQSMGGLAERIRGGARPDDPGAPLPPPTPEEQAAFEAMMRTFAQALAVDSGSTQTSH